MNILFFLTPKKDVAYISENDTLRQAMEKMEHHRYASIPVLSADGTFYGVLSEGDLLFTLKNDLDLDLSATEKVRVSEITMKNRYHCVDISASMKDLVSLANDQSFVPVVDDDRHFIGIVRRKELLRYLYTHAVLDE